MHIMDFVIVAALGLLLFGPKAFQSIAHQAGKGVGQAKSLKDKVLADLPMDELSELTDHIPQVPLNSRQAIQQLLSSETTPEA